MNRLEYGYGSGYINGHLAEERICFAENNKTCVSGIKMLEADQATGVSRDRFGGIIGLAPVSTEHALRAFVDQVSSNNFFSKKTEIDPKFSFYLSKNKG